MIETILLVRHGQTRSNITGAYMGWTNEDLNDTGHSQANRLCSRLSKQPVDLIYSSPLQRTCTTATILAEPHGLKAGTSDALIEIKLGDWEGLHMDEISQRWPELWKQWRADPSQISLPNGESFNQVNRRVRQFFEQMVASTQCKLAIIVTHDIVVKSIVSHVLGAPASIYRQFNIDNASISKVRFIDGKARLTTMNDTSHLNI
jgi:alpha-ribazole phosphatase